MAVVRPSLLGVASSQPVVSMVGVAVTVMAVICVVTVEVGLEVTLAIPPAPATAEERRETGLLASPGRGTHGSPSWSELEVSGGDVARP